MDIWEIIQIFELLCFQVFLCVFVVVVVVVLGGVVYFLERLLQIKGKTAFTQPLAGFYS